MKTLDIYDNKLISLFKLHNGTVTLDKLRKIWGERCSISECDVSIRDIINNLLKLAITLDLLRENKLHDFIWSLKQRNNFKYTCTNCDYLSENEDDFNLILLPRLDSLFALTDVKDLPGFEVIV